MASNAENVSIWWRHHATQPSCFLHGFLAVEIIGHAADDSWHGRRLKSTDMKCWIRRLSWVLHAPLINDSVSFRLTRLTELIRSNYAVFQFRWDYVSRYSIMWINVNAMYMENGKCLIHKQITKEPRWPFRYIRNVFLHVTTNSSCTMSEFFLTTMNIPKTIYVYIYFLNGPT